MFDSIVRRFFLCSLCLALVLLTGCPKKDGEDDPKKKADKSPTKAEVIVDAVSKDDVQMYIYTEGRTVPSNSVEIRTRVSGYLQHLFFKPGSIVKEGDRLALVEPDTYQIALDAAKAGLINSKAQAALAEADLERTKSLLERGAATTQDYQTQLANRDMALAAVELANTNIQNAELNLRYTDVRSPITGKTTKNLVDIGNYVSPTGSQSVLLSINQLDPMFVEFKLNDRQYADLKDRIGFRKAYNEAIKAVPEEKDENAPERPLALTGMPVDVSLMTGVNVFSFDFDIPGKIVALVDNQISWATGQVTLRAELRNPLLKTDDAADYMLYPGAVCRVRIPYETVKDAILIREEAILTDLDTKYVLVIGKGMYQPKDPTGKPLLDKDKKEIPPYETDIVYRRDIKMGKLLDSQRRIVLSGLKPGEMYVVQGVQRVRIGTEVKQTTLEEYEKRRAAATK